MFDLLDPLWIKQTNHDCGNGQGAQRYEDEFQAGGWLSFRAVITQPKKKQRHGGGADDPLCFGRVAEFDHVLSTREPFQLS